ncbi:hypothetical protein [Brevifollis gellanilyticus]|uniref:Uncharacterized protein n=1 Tax=Brevifollis gellanilyticus TaxID=748831 RepID=A0A512M923_9BACT|nr:hypothetical protein [Brevifollis gellanilyticus]GEP43222.1 hypothetical protein BGE01nite_25130 [Brevifollis gellanilyticus]
MKLLDTPSHRPALNFERPSWLVTCSLKRREPFGTVSSQARYELAATNEEEARSAVRNFVQQAHPRCVIESIRVARQNLAQPA